MSASISGNNKHKINDFVNLVGANGVENAVR